MSLKTVSNLFFFNSEFATFGQYNLTSVHFPHLKNEENNVTYPEILMRIEVTFNDRKKQEFIFLH
jgi:hypothetical protein